MTGFDACFSDPPAVASYAGDCNEPSSSLPLRGFTDGHWKVSHEAAAVPLPSSTTSARVLRDAAISGRGVPEQQVADASTNGNLQDSGRQPPGTKASTVRAAVLWNSLRRWILTSRGGKLKSFCHSLLSGAGRGNKPCPLGSVWPIPIPYPEQSRATEDTAETALRRCINIMIMTLNWLHLGSPARAPQSFPTYDQLTVQQHGVVERLRRFCADWADAGDIAAADMGRSAGKVEQLEEQIFLLSSQVALLSKNLGSTRQPPLGARQTGVPGLSPEVVLAKDIEADRLQFQGRPEFNPEPLLTPLAKLWYSTPLDYAIPPDEYFEEVPHVQVKGKRKEILRLLARLDQTGRLAIFAPQSVRDGYGSGMFALMKNAEKDRLILDARPSNCLEQPLAEFTQCMGSPVPILDMVLPADRLLLMSGEDLRDYYYYFAVSPQRAARNFIKFKLSAAEARRFQCFRDCPEEAPFYYPALATMAMGDVNAVEYGQMVHTLLAVRCGLNFSDMVTLRSRCPRQDWVVGLVIDDLIFLEQVPRQLPKLGITEELANAMVEEYRKVGLRAHDEKRFRGEQKAKFWGVAIDGSSGIIRPQVERILPLAFITARVALLGVAERKLLEMVAGSWTSALQLRRRAMCLLSHIFAAIQLFPYGVPFRLTADCIAELWTLVVLAPLFASDLRAGVSTELCLVDASNDWEAEVCAKISPAIAAELSRQKLTKAAWARLLSPLQQLQRMHHLLPPEEEVPEGEEPARSHPLWTAVIRSTSFSLVRRRRIRGKTHINVSELNAALDSEKRRAEQNPDTRLLTASDSQVVLGALVRGRSSSAALNRRLQQSLPHLLCCNVYDNVQYVNTHDNVADDPTRDRCCRAPATTVPSWVAALDDGDYKPHDAILADAGVADADVGRWPSLPPQLQEADTFPPQQLAHRWRRTRVSKSVNKGCFGGKPAVANPASPWLPRHRLSATATELLGRFSGDQFVLPKGAARDEILKFSGHLDLFSGSRSAARAQAEASGRWVLTFDLAHSADEDLLNRDLQKLLSQLVHSGAFLSVAAGPVCASFSRAVRPAVRSRLHPTGLAEISSGMREKVAIGNEMSRWLCCFIREVHSADLVWWVENPAGSFLWLQQEWVSLVADLHLQFILTDYCRWGTPYRKRTRFLSNMVTAGQRLLCRCTRPHIRLVGYSHAHKCSWTKVAEPYPSRLSQFLAKSVVESLTPAERRQPLDINACAKFSGRRIGEASNPGPRPRRQGPFVSDLELVDTVQPSTRLIQHRALEKLDAWLLRELGPETFGNIVDRCPKLRLWFLRAFGNWMYQNGEAMYLFRHLVVHLQQTFPGERSLLAPAWDLLTRWEIVLPVQHRPPLPRIVLDAMLAVSLSWGWHRFAGITALAFHGAMRIGEPLRCFRADLVLPSEAYLQEQVCFLGVRAPKPGRRGRGKVQHSKISDAATVDFVTWLFEHLDPSAALYPSSAGTYRRRWDKVAEALEIPVSSQLTPGSLRGGGAVHLYHSGIQVTDLLWRLRLRHVATLESYLQETAAAGVFAALPEVSKNNVKNASKMLPHFYKVITSRAL